MEGYGHLYNAMEARGTDRYFTWMTIGRVIDTNDPQQMGRVRALCPALGDRTFADIETIPWALHVSPFAGSTSAGVRGASQAASSGGTSYGMWHVPKVDTYVMVGCIDGDPAQRFWIGALHTDAMAHTMPHGRYIWSNGPSGAPDGPLDSNGKPIEPLYSALHRQFNVPTEAVSPTKSGGTGSGGGSGSSSSQAKKPKTQQEMLAEQEAGIAPTQQELLDQQWSQQDDMLAEQERGVRSLTLSPDGSSHITSTRATQQEMLAQQNAGLSSGQTQKDMLAAQEAEFKDPAMVKKTPVQKPRANFEWRTRGADVMVAAVDEKIVKEKGEATGTKVPDHEPGNFTKTTVKQEDKSDLVVKGSGYSQSQIQPNISDPATGNMNYDSHLYSWTSPGFHAISMDDRYWNCRMKLRTTSGHQILLDDTNERIYINTSGGNVWIELDNVGNVDVYSSRNLSFHAEGDINFTTNKTFRVNAGQGVHMYSATELRLHSAATMSFVTDQSLLTKSAQETDIEAGSNIQVYSASTVAVKGDGNVDLYAGACIHTQSGVDTHFKAGNTMYLTGSPNVFVNGPTAESAAQAGPSGASRAFWTNRVPQHEPWARTFMDMKADGDISKEKRSASEHSPEYDYTHKNVGRGSEARGESYERNPNWKR